MKLQDVVKEIYLEHGWELPQGFVDRRERSPLNFSRDEWQQAKRSNQDPKVFKKMFQEYWTFSDSRTAFAQALQAKEKIASQAIKTVQTHQEVTGNKQTQLSAKLALERKQLVERQREARQNLLQAQEARWNAETRARSERLAKGLRGIWHRLTGKYGRVKRQNEIEALLAYQRDRTEKDELIFRHIGERQNLQRQSLRQKTPHTMEISQLREDISHHRAIRQSKSLDVKTEIEKAKKEQLKDIRHQQTHKPDHDPEPEI